MDKKQLCGVAECPNCSAAIDFVIEFSYIPAEWRVSPGGHGRLHFEHLGSYYEDKKELVFLCPECDEVICTSYSDLRRFFGLER